MNNVKPYRTAYDVTEHGAWSGELMLAHNLDPQRLAATMRLFVERSADLAVAQKRIAELEAQVAQHPEQLRRVAEAVALKCESLVRDPEGPEGLDGYSLDGIADRIDFLDLAAIIAEATKR